LDLVLTNEVDPLGAGRSCGRHTARRARWTAEPCL